MRQAISYAVDRDFITKALHRGVSTPQRGPIIESSPFFDADASPAYDVDLDKAKALMTEAGFGDGMELTVDYIPGPAEQQKSIAEYLKSQLAKIGIDVTVRAAPDFPTWAGRVGGHDFELTMDVVFNWGDPVIGVHRTYLTDNIRQGVIWSNTQSYSNARVDEILAQAAIEGDFDKRKALYSEFQAHRDAGRADLLDQRHALSHRLQEGAGERADGDLGHDAPDGQGPLGQVIRPGDRAARTLRRPVPFL